MGNKLTSNYWLVEHIGNNEEEVNAWWGNLQKTMEDGKMEEEQKKMQTKNCIGRAFMPTMDTNKIFCLWETHYTMVHQEQNQRIKLENHLTKKVTGNAFNDQCHCITSPINLVPETTNEVDPKTVWANSKMFMVEHRGLNQGAVLAWRNHLSENIEKNGFEPVIKGMREDQSKNGVYNHFYMDTSVNNVMFCLWEVKKCGHEEKKLSKYIESNITKDAFYNIFHEINLEATDVYKVLEGNQAHFSDAKLK